MSPLFAVVDGEARRAFPANRGFCPSCGAPMIAKCGQIVVWHWAHVSATGCNAYVGESRWHLNWKARFADAGARVEVIQRRNGTCHIADVVLPSGRVLELAGTYHPASAIEAREQFYGRMSWLYNAAPFFERVEFYDDRDLFWFKQPPQSMLTHNRWPMFWDYLNTVHMVKKLWRFRDRVYGELTSEGSKDEFVQAMVEAR